FAAHLPEFWQQGDEREGQHRADAWHRGQQLIALSDSTIGGNHLGQALVELFGLICRTDSPAASRARMIPRSEPPLGSRPIAETVSGRNLATSSAQPAVSLLTEKNHPSGSTTTSKRSFDTSTPQKESMAIFVSHPC